MCFSISLPAALVLLSGLSVSIRPGPELLALPQDKIISNSSNSAHEVGIIFSSNKEIELHFCIFYSDETVGFVLVLGQKGAAHFTTATFIVQAVKGRTDHAKKAIGITLCDIWLYYFHKTK